MKKKNGFGQLLDSFIRLLINKKHAKARRTLATVLAGIVVFTTTYLLILPALTVDIGSVDEVGMILPMAEGNLQEEPSYDLEEYREDNGDILIDDSIPEEDYNYNTDEYGYGDGNLSFDYEGETYPEADIFNEYSTSPDEGTYDQGIVGETQTNDSSQEFIIPPEEYDEATAEAGNADLDNNGSITETPYELNAESRGVDLKLSYSEPVPADTEVKFEEVDSADFENYLFGAAEEIGKYYEGRSVAGGQFWHVVSVAGSQVEAEFNFNPAVYDDNGNIIFSSDLEYALYDQLAYDSNGQLLYRVDGLREAVDSGNILLVEWAAGEWHIFAPETVRTEADNTIIRISSVTDSLINSAADFGIVVLEPVGSEQFNEEFENVDETNYFDGESEEYAETSDIMTEEGFVEEAAEAFAEEIVEETSDELVDESEETLSEEAISEEPADETAESSEEETEEESEEDDDEDSIPDSEDSEEGKAGEGEEHTEDTAQGETDIPTPAGDYFVPVEGADYSLHIEYGEDARIPANSEFVAVVVEDDDFAAKALDAVKEAVDESNEADVADTDDHLGLVTLFDLTIYSDGAVIQPQAPISVSVVFDEERAENEQIYAVHFPGTGEQPQELPEDVAAQEDAYAETADNGAESGSDVDMAEVSVTDEDIQEEVIAEYIDISQASVTDEDIQEEVIAEYIDISQASVSDDHAQGEVPIDYTDISQAQLTEESVPDAELYDNVDLQLSPEDTGLALDANVGAEDIVAEVFGTVQSADSVTFMTNGLSYYALVSYTVDFHWDVNGKEYEFNIPGGGYISFKELVSALGIVGSFNTESAEDLPYKTEDEENLAVDAFVEDVVNITFTSPELLSISKVTEATTVGAIKDALGLECAYSAELTEDQIQEINNAEVKPIDWILISLAAFDTEESLVVTMKNGEEFTIKVTDDQIRNTIITASGETYEITVTYENSAGIPAGSELRVTEILPEAKEYQDYYTKALDKINALSNEDLVDNEALVEEASPSATRTSEYSRFFNIEIWNGDEKVEPEDEVLVDIRLLDAPDPLEAEPMVVHFAEAGIEVMNLKETDSDESALQFTTDEFSVYSVIYTVDYHYEVNGKMYEFSIPGGGFASLEHVVEVLGIARIGENTAGSGENQANEGEIGAENDENTADSDVYNGVEETGVDDNGANGSNYEESISLNNVEVSEATKKFVADVASVEFSSPELVWVVKVDETTTVGGLKEANGLEVQYSAELTEEQIAEINSSTVEGGDWALISVLPFTSEESLTVTMKNGDVFVVKVTDAQISTHVITADGKDYIITVTYGPEAGIPDDAKLEAEEIPADSEKYESMLEQSKKALAGNGDTDILFSRFFDISILNKDGEEIEPTSPVSVTIQYANPINMAEAKPSIVHFAEDGIEVIRPNTRLVCDENDETKENAIDAINVFEYRQGSFSGVGTIVETDTLEDGEYFIIVGENGSYYAMKNDGSLVPVTYYSQTKQVEAPYGTNENDLLWNVSSAGYGYYTFKAVNGGNYLALQNGSVVASSSSNINVRVQHNAWDETQNETGGYYLYHAPNPWDANTWDPLCLGYWDNASHFYVGDSGSTPQRIKLYKYVMSTTTGEPPTTSTYTGIEVNPSELDEWLMSLFDDMPIGYDGYHKTAEVYDYENRIYQIDFTALSNAQGFASDIDIAFSVDMSNSMLFPSTLSEIGTIELRQSVLENTLEKDQVYFIISDINQTSTVTAVFYEGGVWKHEDASKFARGQRNQSNTDIVVGNDPGYKIQGTDTGFYTLYKAEPGYVEYIRNNGSVWENPYNRLADMKQSLRMAFNFLDIMREKYHAKIRVGWNGFARNVECDNGKTGQSQEKFDYRCYENGHALQDLENVDYNDIISGFADAGSQTGGGTRPDKAFIDAANMGWGTNTQKYLILITDGAPQGGGAQNPAAALSLGIQEGKNLTRDKGVNIISIGLSTEHVENAGSDSGLFKNISCQDPNPGSDQQMIYQAKDGDALKNAVVDALRILVSKAITVGTVKDTIDPAFYPVSTDGTPLKAGDKIDLNGKLTTDTSKPYGVINWDGENWTVEWTDQDILWPDEEHPHGWHGRVLVKAKENFLGGNGISTNKGDAALDVKHAKVLNSNGTWSAIPFQTLMNLKDDQLETRYMDTPHVNVDELEMTQNDTEWTVYLNTEVDPAEQMEALFNEIKVMKVVTDGEHEMLVQNGKTAQDVMVYGLVPTEDGNYSYEEASSDARNKRDVDQAFFYLKDLFTMKDSLNNDFILDDMTAEQAIDRLLAGEKVEVKYQGYGHGTADKPVGKIILELKADPNAQVNDLTEHDAGPVGNAVEKYILSAEYKPEPAAGSGTYYWNTGSFGTKDKGTEAEDKTKYNTHTINVIKRILTIRKTDSAGNVINDPDAGEASFTISHTDAQGHTASVDAVTTNGVYTWDYVVPDKDQKIPGDYWADTTAYTITETTPPTGYVAFDGTIPVTLAITDTKTPLRAAEGNEKVPYNWTQTASLSAEAPNNYVSVNGNNDISISVRNDRVGSLKIKKNVSIPAGLANNIADGTYTFTLWNADATTQITKKADGTDVGTLQLTISNGVSAELTVDKLKPGTYVIKETGSDNDAVRLDTSAGGYSSSLGGIAVTVSEGDVNGIQTAAFTNKYETTEATVRKVWLDNNNEKNKRPSSLTVTLYADGEPTDHTVTLTTSTWESGAAVHNLPKYKDGEEINYYWVEGEMPVGYFLKNVSRDGTITTLTNSYSEYDLETTYTGVKNWSDESDLYGTRPNELVITLQRRVNDTDSWSDYRSDPSWQKTGNIWTYTFNHLPVFDENGNVYKYRAVETVPAGYSEAESNTPTVYNFGTITYLSTQESHKRVTPDNKLIWPLDSLIDLAFAAVKTTSNDPTLVWTSRMPTPQEKAAIEQALASKPDPLPGHNKTLRWIHGNEIATDSHGAISFSMEGLQVTLKFEHESVWSQFILGQFNNESGSESTYQIGTTSFTNSLETTELHGTKTWNIEGDEVTDNPVLTLTRTYTVTAEGEGGAATTSSPETVKVEGENLQPVWSGEGKTRSFSYTGLPKYAPNGAEYTYSVAEASFTLGTGADAVTYTVTRGADGKYTVTADKEGAEVFYVTQNGNDIVNSSVNASIEIIKVEEGHKDEQHTLNGAKFRLTRVNANNDNNMEGEDAYQSGIQQVVDGKTTFSGLKPGRYKLEEMEAPAGYILIESPWFITVDQTGAATLKAGYTMASPNEDAVNSFFIENRPGAALPNTGGPGTNLIYLLGLLLTSLAGTGMLMKRRRRNAA